MRTFQLEAFAYGLAAVALLALGTPAFAEGDATKGQAAPSPNAPSATRSARAP